MENKVISHWSYSSLNKFLSCSLAYYFDKIEKLKQETYNSSGILGTACHQALCLYYNKLKAGVKLQFEDLFQFYEMTLNNEIKGKPIEYKEDEDYNSLLENGKVYLTSYLNSEIAAEIEKDEILGVEKQFTVPLVYSTGEVISSQLIGWKDLVIKRNNRIICIDFKFAKKSLSDIEIENSVQAVSYLYADFMEKIDSTFCWVQILKNKTKPVVKCSFITRDSENYDRFISKIKVAEKAVCSGVFLPNEGSFFCYICGFKKRCKEWGKNNL